MNENNRSHDTTRRMILDTFYQMVMESSFDEVSIQDLCRRCGISRRTFYNYYTDKYNLALTLWSLNYLESRPADSHKSRYEMFIDNLKLDYRHRYYYRKLLNDDKNNIMSSRLQRWLENFYLTLMADRFDRNDKASALFTRYHAAGVNSLILSWLKEDSDISAEKLAEIISYNLPQELRDRIFNHSSPFPDFDSLF
ncbi:MAG: TetR/AcrR family transcriptional regulator [Solobacterium sp.]|nr:TetR/AcrR family transcriptional regulator [Solobacterium sp.]MBQ6357305.1 TetR/AcrR family transcriptional regulator [Solobacterium sp.]